MAKYTFFLALLCVLELSYILADVQESVQSKVVKISSGPVRGYKDKKTGIYEFYGIPYASAPTGEDRFKAPLPAPIWLETLEAVDKNIICPQYNDKSNPMHDPSKRIVEDCLIANVFVPDTDETNLPVVVYVHGGAYQIGNALFLTPEDLVKQGNIIVVNFNYRLGIHGFLCLGTEGAPGNAGMKDQVAALKWVNKNIAKFGGNPEDVTIAGYSAGSSSVELLGLSRSTRGLFHKVIPESGAGVGVWSVQQNPVEIARKYAMESLNYTADNVSELEAFYKTTPLDKMQIDSFMNEPDSTFVFVPCVERPGPNAFLTEAPLDILKKGKFEKTPFLVGFSNMEGLFRIDVFNDWKDKMNEKFSKFLPADLKFSSEEEREEVASAIKKFYFGDEAVSETTVQKFVDYFTDVIFAYPILRSVRLQVEAGNTDVFLYEFSYVEEAFYQMMPFKIRGANHCSQSVMVQNADLLNVITPSENFEKMRKVMRDLWIRFIKTGKPVKEATPDFPSGWPAASAEGSPYMQLDLPPQLKGALLPERARFWDDIYSRYYSTPQPPSTGVEHSEL
uniref:Carboxylic ester hydrolase n=1 Tax=Plutella xylostella TaxID=51655 RepID=A0A1L8D6M6_PLUXY